MSTDRLLWAFPILFDFDLEYFPWNRFIQFAVMRSCKFAVMENIEKENED